MASLRRAETGNEPWRWDDRYMRRQTLLHLPLVLVELRLEPLGAFPIPVWWPHGRGLSLAVRRLHGLWCDSILLCVDEDRASLRRRPIYIDRFTGRWLDPETGKQGLTLVALTAWRLHRTETSAAWTLARAIGLEAPRP